MRGLTIVAANGRGAASGLPQALPADMPNRTGAYCDMDHRPGQLRPKPASWEVGGRDRKRAPSITRAGTSQRSLGPPNTIWSFGSLTHLWFIQALGCFKEQSLKCWSWEASLRLGDAPLRPYQGNGVVLLKGTAAAASG